MTVNDHALAAAAVPFPADECDFTPTWFTQALVDRFPRAEVVKVELLRRIGGTAAKYRFRLTWSRSGSDPAPPETLWAKGGFETGGADQGEAFANETRFYRDLAPRIGAGLPNCYYGAVDDRTNNGLVLLEDLTLRGASFPTATEPLTPDQAHAVLELQARYHARFWNDPALAKLDWLKAGGSIAGTGMVDQYFDGFWDAAQRLPRFRHVPNALRDRSRIQAALNRMIEADARRPICLVHGDSQAANLFFDDQGVPGYLDWQHVMRGHWAFDLAHLVVTGLSIADRRIHERSLLKAYRARLAAFGVEPPPLSEMWRDYQRHALWAFMWVMCPVSAHPEDACTANAARACAAITDLDSLGLNEAGQAAA